MLTVQRDGPEAALEADIERLGLGEGLDDWSPTPPAEGGADPQEADETAEGLNEEAVVAKRGAQQQHDGSNKNVAVTQSISLAPKGKARTGFDSYSKWDNFVDSDDEEQQAKPADDQRQQLQALAGQLGSFQQARQAREKEREAYWAKHSVFNK